MFPRHLAFQRAVCDEHVDSFLFQPGSPSSIPPFQSRESPMLETSVIKDYTFLFIASILCVTKCRLFYHLKPSDCPLFYASALVSALSISHLHYCSVLLTGLSATWLPASNLLSTIQPKGFLNENLVLLKTDLVEKALVLPIGLGIASKLFRMAH